MKKIILSSLFILLVASTQAQVIKKQSNKKSNLSSVRLGDPNAKSSNYLRELIKNENLDYVITSEHISNVSGTRHVYLRQAINGLEVFGTESSIHIGENEKIIASHNNFLNNINSTIKNTSASISAEQAIVSVAQQMNYTISDLHKIEDLKGVNQKATFNKAGISGENIPIKLMYYYQEGIGTTMVWELSIMELNTSDWWNFRVDASSGVIIDKDNWTVTCNVLGKHSDHNHNKKSLEKNIKTAFPTNSEEKEYKVSNSGLLVGGYRVFAMPLESPYFGSRTLENNPDDATASPFGWHDTDGIAGAEFNYTKGNNADAYDDDNNSNSGTVAKHASGGGSLIFDFAFDATTGGNPIYNVGNQSEDAAVTNLFYWNNIIHDVMYHYGFDEVSGNFQENNYGNGGAGGDSVNAEAQDGLGTCNANFGTPSDGGNPRMQMYLCDNSGTSDSNDGDYDNLVIVHEYGHGISNRLTGGPANAGALGNSEQMGEGWSDFYGVMLTMSPTNFTNDRTVGTFLFEQGAGGSGIRPTAYSTNLAVNGSTYGDLPSAVVPHGVGYLWATMLYDMTQDLITQYGFDPDLYSGTGGNNIAIILVTEGLKLQPTSPGFIDGRDAILAADNSLYGGANQCLIWEAFARRGLGFSATQGSSSNNSDGTEAFDLPPGTAIFTNSIDDLCITEGIQTGLGGGTPTGGTYSGLGVTDDGNGTTYTFDPSVAGVGTATVTYNVVDSCTGGPVNLNDTIEVSDGNPLLSCQNATVTLDGSGNASIVWQDVVSNFIPGGYTRVDAAGNSLEIFTGGVTNVNLGDDNGTAALNIGFDFNFYSTTYTEFYIASNGFVSFDGLGMNPPESPTATTLPTPSIPNNMVAVVWDDLDPSAGGTIKYEVFGTAPNRKLVVEYLNVPFWNAVETVSAQAHFYEGTNNIEIHLIDVQTDGGVRTLGIENSDGTAALTHPVTNLGNWTSGPFTISFLPQPDSFANNCGNSVSLSLAQSDFTCQDIGDVIVTVTADDGNGGVSTCDATVTVIGTTSTFASGSWDVAPNSGVKALFSDNYDTDTFGDVTACSCEIELGKTVTVNAGGYLDIVGNILVDGALLIENEGSVVQVNDAAAVTNNGTISVEKITPSINDRGFTILGSPMSGETTGGVYTNAAFVRYHDTDLFAPNAAVAIFDPLAENFADEEGDNWVAHTGALTVGEGYLVKPYTIGSGTNSPFTTDYTLGTLNNGVITFTTKYNTGGTPEENQNASPNILSNPYASAIDAKLFISNNALVDAIYFWEHITAPNASYPGYNSNNYDMGDISYHNGLIGIEAAHGGGIPSDFIPSGQGFGIKANALGDVTFNNVQRVTGNNTGYRNSNVDLDKLYVRVSNETYGLKSSVGIGFTELATNDYGIYDTKRLATSISLYSLVETNELGIQGRSVFNLDHIIPLGFSTQVEENQEYTISISYIEGALISEAIIYLQDNLLGTVTNLSETDYTFNANVGHQTDRFVIVFTEEVLGSNDLSINAISLYPNPTNSILNIVSPLSKITNVTVYDVQGRIISEAKVKNLSNYQLNLENVNSAMYFVKIVTERGSITKRVVKE